MAMTLASAFRKGRRNSKMTSVHILALLLCTTISQSQGASVFDWVWGKGAEESTVLVADGVPLVSIPYESMTEDEKFLQEAAKFTEIQVASPLETCQHKVIMKLKTSCSGMSEEQLAKLSVNLLNCQSAVEGRKQFPCTEEMSLKQCTTDMDADMWNAYHLMSNRARAVCYSARSTQFRALTELTVNKLMSTTHSQIQTLTSLKEGQERLEHQTTEALASLSKGNKALLQQQQNLQDAQTTAHQLVTTNLRELSNERALIRSGHAQLSAMAEDIRKKLEEASENLVQQSLERSENHREVLEDLMKIQGQAQEIWEKIETSTTRIFEQQEEALDQYEKTLHKLIQINDTIHFVWDVTNTMRSELDEKLNWIASYIGDTGEQVHRMWRGTLHIIYILVAMVIAAFLQAPFLTRLSILCIVPLNLISFLKHGMDACLDFASITVLILLITTMHYVMAGIQYLFVPRAVQTKKMIQENGQANGVIYKPTPTKSNTSVLSNLARGISDLLRVLMYKLKELAFKCKAYVESMMSWTKRTVAQQEELSCSYVPSKKMHNGTLYDHPSMMSEDGTDFEVSREMAKHDYYSDDDFDHLVDANDLRLRLARIKRPSSRASTRASSSSFLSGAMRTQCNATTKAGKPCRLFSSPGREFCSRHILGTSIHS